MSTSFSSRRFLAQLLCALGFTEKSVEFSRQILAENPDFEPYTAFKRINRSRRGKISETELLSFIEDSGVHLTQEENRQIFQFLDRDDDGFVSYEEFIDAVLPRQDDVAKKRATLREPYYVGPRETLPKDTEFALSRVFEKEIDNLRVLNRIKDDLNSCLDFNPSRLFDSLDDNSQGFLDFDSVDGFLKEMERPLSEFEIEGVFLRLDRNRDGKIDLEEFRNGVKAEEPSIGERNSIRMSPVRNEEKTRSYEPKKEEREEENNENDGKYVGNEGEEEKYKEEAEAPETPQRNQENRANYKSPVTNSGGSRKSRYSSPPKSRAVLNMEYDEYLRMERERKQSKPINQEPFEPRRNFNEAESQSKPKKEEGEPQPEREVVGSRRRPLRNRQARQEIQPKRKEETCEESLNENQTQGNLEAGSRLQPRRVFSFKDPVEEVDGEDETEREERNLQVKPQHPEEDGEKYKESQATSSNGGRYRSGSPAQAQEGSRHIVSSAYKESTEEKRTERNQSSSSPIRDSSSKLKNASATRTSPLEVRDEKQLGTFLSKIIESNAEVEKYKNDLSLRVDFTLMDAFRLFDTSEKGFISLRELENGLGKLGIYSSREKIALFFNRFNVSESGSLRYSEFADALTPKQPEYASLIAKRESLVGEDFDELTVFTVETRRLFKRVLSLLIENEVTAEQIREGISTQDFSLEDAFNYLDKNQDGFITPSEFQETLREYGIVVTKSEVASIVERYDTKRKGRVSYDDFIRESKPKTKLIF